MSTDKTGAAPAATARLAGWWHAREPRERWMLAVMCAAIAAFVAWYAVLAPLQGLRQRAADRHAAAALDAAEVERGLAVVAAASDPASAPLPAEALHALVTDSAGAAGITFDRREATPDGGLEVGTDAVDALPLFNWLDGLRLEHAIAPVAVDIERREGRLRAQLRFAPAQ